LDLNARLGGSVCGSEKEIRMTPTHPTSLAPKKKLYEHLYFQVLCGMIIGVLLGYFYPQAASATKPLGDAFIKL
jgi:hypothetical protein